MASPGATTPVVIVLDASGSMNTSDAPGPRIAAAKQAVISLVRSLPSSAEVGLLTYGTGTDSSAAARTRGCSDLHVLAPVQRIDRTAVVRAVRAVRARGYTPIGAALTKAADMLPAGRAGSIVLVSDGEDTCAPPDPCSVARTLDAAHRELVVHTVGFRVGASARDQLGCIARATGGTYRDVHGGAALGPVLRSQVDAGLRPYVVSGTPIDGTATASGAPPITSGQYADRFRAANAPVTKYYTIRLTAPETFYVAATVVPPALRGGGTGNRLELSAELRNSDGDRCLSSEREHDAVLAGKVDPVTVVVSGVVGGESWSKRCARSGRFVVAVTRDSGSSTSTGSEIVVRIEPAVRNAPPPVTTIPPGLPAPAATASHRACLGGASFDTAPALRSGTCRDTLSTGETRYYRVHLDWGQRLAYRIVVDRVAGAGHGTAYVQSAVATPLRQEVTLASTSNAARDFGGPVGITLTGSTLVPADYGNRDSARSDVRGYALAGDYYLSLGMTYPITALPYRTGVTVTVRVAGRAVAGPQHLPLPGAATTPASEPEATSAPAPTARRSASAAASSRGTAWAAGAAGAIALIALGGLLVVRLRRRGAR